MCLKVLLTPLNKIPPKRKVFTFLPQNKNLLYTKINTYDTLTSTHYHKCIKMPEKEKKKLPKLPSIIKMMKDVYRDMIAGFKELKNDLPNMREKLKNPVKTQYELGLYHAQKENLTDAKFRFWITTILDKNHAYAWYRMGWADFLKGKPNKAKKSLEKALAIKPDLKEAKFWLDNINEKETINEIPLQVIKEDADRWADIYDMLFLNELQYVGHEAVCKNVLDNLEGKTVLDLGCGTGLCGKILRQKAGKIVGVDISPKMIEHANNLYLFETEEEIENDKKDEKNTENNTENKEPVKKVKVYDELVENDIISYFRNTNDKFDVIVGAYTFNFFSNLSELLSLCKKALTPNGKLSFSVELMENGDYKFSQEVGMFIHSDKYIRKTLDENGFKVIKDESVKLYGDCLNGVLYTCQLVG